MLKHILGYLGFIAFIFGSLQMSVSYADSCAKVKIKSQDASCKDLQVKFDLTACGSIQKNGKVHCHSDGSATASLSNRGKLYSIQLKANSDSWQGSPWIIA